MSHTLNDASATAKIAVSADPTALARLRADRRRALTRSLAKSLLNALLTFVVLIALWQAVVSLTGISPYVAKGPLDVWTFLVTGDDAQKHRDQLLPHLGQTLADSLIGFVVGMIVAIVLAIAFSLSKAVEAGVMPLVLLLRTIPLVSIAPVIILITGRGTPASVAVIGNGNTAASAVAACTVMLKNGQTNKRITVAARHPGKNWQLPDIIGEGDAIAYEEKTIDASADTLRDADIVISTIPGHAADAVAEAIGNDDSFRPRGILLDVVYDPRPSALIRAWRAKGGLAIGGEEMLLWQAILQVILMTGADTADSSLTDVLEPAMRHAREEAL